MKYRIADEVECRVRGNEIVSSDAINYDYSFIFEIVGTEDPDYFLFVSQNISLDRMFLYDQFKIRNFPDINKRFINSNIIRVIEQEIVRLHQRRYGMSCARCKEFCSLAEPNQPDGTLMCYACRCNPYR